MASWKQDKGDNMYRGTFTYVGHAPIPVPMANCLQVLQMCDAFSNTGERISLIVPRLLDSMESVYANCKTGSFLVHQLYENTRVSLVDLYPLHAAVHARKEHASVLYTRSLYAALWGVLLGCKVFWEIHTPETSCSSRYWALKQRLFSLRKGLRGVIAVSGRMASRLRDAGIPDDMILVAHDAVDLDTFHDGHHERTGLRASLGYTEKDCVAVYTGKFDLDRGVFDLIEVAPALPDVKFLLIGASEEQIQEMSPALPDNVKVMGYLHHKQVPGYLAAADILLSPHRSSTNIIDVCSPLKIFEYMAMSKPIVISDFPVFREILEPGKDAFFYEPDNLDSLVATLRLVSSSPDLAGVVAAAARKKVQDHSWEARACKIREFMGKCLGGA